MTGHKENVNFVSWRQLDTIVLGVKPRTLSAVWEGKADDNSFLFLTYVQDKMSFGHSKS